MKTSLRSALAVLLVAGSAALVLHLQTASAQAEPGSMPETSAPQAQNAKPMPSPPAQAEVTLNGKAVTIHYNSPRMRGRKIMGELVPYGKEWRTGANPATSFVTDV